MCHVHEITKEMKEMFDFKVTWISKPIWTCFSKIIRNVKEQFSPLVCCHYGILKITIFCQITKAFSTERVKSSLTWFLLLFVLKERCQQDYSLIKQKIYHKATSHVVQRLSSKSYSRFPLNCKQQQVEARSNTSSCKIYFPIFSGITRKSSKVFWW